MFSGEKDANVVLTQLNHVKGDSFYKDTRERIIEILKMMRDHLEQVHSSSKWPPAKRNVGPFETNDPFFSLNDALTEHTMFPAFCADNSERGWHIQKTAISPKIAPDEIFAIHALVELAEQNRLDRLKECACGRWYFARFAHQRFCSAECREKFWEESEERKAQKRERARSYYQIHKVHGKDK